MCWLCSEECLNTDEKQISMNHNSNSHNIISHTGLDVEMEVTQCTGHVSANTRRHQLCWDDWEWVYYMSCARNTDVCTCTCRLHHSHKDV